MARLRTSFASGISIQRSFRRFGDSGFAPAWLTAADGSAAWVAWALLALLPLVGTARAGENAEDTQAAARPGFVHPALPEHHANQVRYFAEALTHPDAEVRREAIGQIRRLDHHRLFTAALIEPLTEALRHPETRDLAAGLLVELGEPAIPALASVLQSDERSVRLVAALAVLRILSGEQFRPPYGSGPEEYLAEIQQQAAAVALDVLADPAAQEWISVARAAQYLPPPERHRAVAPLLRMLHEGPHRDAAVMGLAWMEVDGLAALVVATNADETQVRAAAIDGLEYYASHGTEEALKATLPVLKRAEDDPSRRVSLTAKNALAEVRQQLARKPGKAGWRDEPPNAVAQRSARRALLKRLGITATDPEKAIPELAARLYGPKDGPEDSVEARQLMQESMAQALATFGEPARPYLLKGLGHEDEYVRSEVIEAIGDRQPDFQEAIPLMIDALRSEDRGIREDAARALAHMRPTRKEWLPLLVDALDEDARGVPAALARYGPIIAPRLLERIGDPDDPGAEAAARMFARLEPPPGEDLIKELIDLLGSENENVLHRARRALMGGWQFTQPHLIEALHKHPDPQVRRWVALSLRLAPVAPDLLKALEDPDRSVRIAAAQMLAVVAPGVMRWSTTARRMVPMLADAALDPELPPALDPVAALRVLGDHAQEAIPQMVDLLPTARSHEAAQFLVERGAAAVPALRELLRSEDKTLRQSAIRVVRRIGRPARAAAPELVERAREGAHYVERLMAAHALAAVQSAPEVALETICRIVEKYPVSHWEARAIPALVELAGFYEPAVPELAPLLTRTTVDPETGQRRWIVPPEHLRAIGKSVPAAPKLTAALQQVALGHNWSEGRKAAFKALQQVGPGAASEIAAEYYDQLAEKKEQERRR